MASKLGPKLAPERFTQAVLRSFLKESESRYLSRLFLSHMRVTGATPGRVHFEVDIQTHHAGLEDETLALYSFRILSVSKNKQHNIHGGALASLVDLGGSLAIASRGHFYTGVSTDLNVSYLAAGGRPGDKLYGNAECDRMGRRMAFTSVTFRNSMSELVARGSHTKYFSKSIDDDQLYTLPIDECLDGESQPIHQEKSEEVG